ncbi:MAG: ABC transporter permease [Paracoccaceae bacterium]
MTSQSQFPSPQMPRQAAPRLRFASFRAIGALVLREMATENGKHPGGYIWAVLEPVAAIVVLTIIFSFGFRSPSIGINFPIFYATGILPFGVYADIAGKTGTAIMFSRALLAYPTVTFMDAIIARLVVNLLTHIMVCFIVFGGILIIFETRTMPDIPIILSSFALAIGLGIGVGSVNCVLFTLYPLWQKVWALITRPLFLASCVFFIFDNVPPMVQQYLWWNPLVHVVGQMRHGFYPSYDAQYVSLIYGWSVALSLTLIGIIFMRRYNRDMINA